MTPRLVYEDSANVAEYNTTQQFLICQHFYFARRIGTQNYADISEGKTQGPWKNAQYGDVCEFGKLIIEVHLCSLTIW